MQFGVNKQSKIFGSLSVSYSLIIQFVIITEQLVFLQRNSFHKNFDVISKQKAV